MNNQRDNLIWAVNALASKANLEVKVSGEEIILRPPSLPEEIYKDIVGHLNLKTNSTYKHTTEATRALIRRLISQDYTPEDIKAVIDYKSNEWLGDSKWQPYLRPSTLFNSNKFEGYIAAARVNGGTKNMYDLLKDDWE